MNQETIISIVGLILTISTIVYGIKLRIAAKRLKAISSQELTYKANLQQSTLLVEFVNKSTKRQGTHRKPIQRPTIIDHLVVENLEEHLEEVYE